MGHHTGRHRHPLRPGVKIIGSQHHLTKTKTFYNTWTTLTNKIKALAHETYLRELRTLSRVLSLHVYLLSLIWYYGHRLPTDNTAVRQLSTTIIRFTWQDDIFRLPLSKLCLPLAEGGAELIYNKPNITNFSQPVHDSSNSLRPHHLSIPNIMVETIARRQPTELERNPAILRIPADSYPRVMLPSVGCKPQVALNVSFCIAICDK
jgi:hypothetical protein